MPPLSKRCAMPSTSSISMAPSSSAKASATKRRCCSSAKRSAKAHGHTGPKIDIALDPLEGTTITAKAGPNALAVLAIAEEGGLLNAPDVYMDKIAVGPGYPAGVIDLRKSATENVKSVAAAKGVAPGDLIVCVLDRPRHEALIAELRGLGCGIMLIPDGDVAGVIATTNPDTGIDIYMGSGGAPEGVLAAAALRCVGGQLQGKLVFRNDDERGRARRWGITDLDRIYDLERSRQRRCHLRCHRRHRWLAAERRQAPPRRGHHHPDRSSCVPPRAPSAGSTANTARHKHA